MIIDQLTKLLCVIRYLRLLTRIYASSMNRIQITTDGMSNSKPIEVLIRYLTMDSHFIGT